MRVKTSELSGAALDWAVAKCEGVECDEDNEPVWFDHDGPYAPRCPYTPSTNWAQGGPIIEAAQIQISSTSYSEGYWCYAQCMGSTKELSGPTPLIAAMRCYVASKRGAEVDVPDELWPSS
jgi:hypothetical protein